MNYLAASMIPVTLPIILFVLTLIIIFSLRVADKKNRSTKNIKNLCDKFTSECETSLENFKQFAGEFEQTIAQKTGEVKELIKTVNAQLGEIKSYSDDLAELQRAMGKYRVALEGLGRLTQDADVKVQTVTDDVDRLDKIRDVIDGFRQDMKDADEHLRKHEQRVIQLEKESVGRMNDAVSATDSSMDEAMANLLRESEEIFDNFKEKTDKDTDLRLRKIDDAFQAVIHTVQQFFGEIESKISEAQVVSERLGFITSSAVEASAAFEEHDLAVSEKIEETKPLFKAPKFTPKPEDDSDKVVITPMEEDSDEIIDGVDDFDAFGGVDYDDNSDFRGMDIMDMEFTPVEDEINK